MLNLFLIAERKGRTIHIKVNSSIHSSLHDVLIDFGFTLYKGTAMQWDYQIENGNSYEIDTEIELNQFIKNNINFTKNRTHEI